MKKIINGKKYDTHTAKAIHVHGNGYFYSDFQHYSETLYKKKTGEYFLYGEGGPMSKYAEYYGNTTTGGDKIIPLSEERARKWCETHMDVDAYEREFGEVDE